MTSLKPHKTLQLSIFAKPAQLFGSCGEMVCFTIGLHTSLPLERHWDECARAAGDASDAQAGHSGVAEGVEPPFLLTF